MNAFVIKIMKKLFTIKERVLIFKKGNIWNVLKKKND